MTNKMHEALDRVFAKLESMTAEEVVAMMEEAKLKNPSMYAFVERMILDGVKLPGVKP